MPALVKSQAQSQLLFRNAEMDVRWRDDTITFTKRPGLLFWFALACVAAVGAFMLFDKIVAPSAAQQQFSTGVAKVLAGVGALFVALVPEALSAFGEIHHVLFGLALVAVVMLCISFILLLVINALQA